MLPASPSSRAIATKRSGCFSAPARVICWAALRKPLPVLRLNCSGSVAVSISVLAYQANAPHAITAPATSTPKSRRKARSIPFIIQPFSHALCDGPGSPVAASAPRDLPDADDAVDQHCLLRFDYPCQRNILFSAIHSRFARRLQDPFTG